MQLFATFVKTKCNFFNFLVQQKLAPVIRITSGKLHMLEISSHYLSICFWTDMVLQ